VSLHKIGYDLKSKLNEDLKQIEVDDVCDGNLTHKFQFIGITQKYDEPPS